MKKVILLFFILILAASGYLAYLFYQKPDYIELNFIHKFLANNIYEKWEAKIKNIPEDTRAVVDYDTLMNELNFFEKIFAEKIFSIAPIELGFKGPFYSRSKPENLIKIESVKAGDRETGVQYCPSHSFEDYSLMMEQMINDIGKKLYIDSGYRSPGRQAYLFFFYLSTSSNYSLLENARWIAMPGYSEHGHPINNAIDFCNADGINGFSDGQTAEDFESLVEYEWLTLNANRFNFYLSYPIDNPHGVAFEPWHWHWEEK